MVEESPIPWQEVLETISRRRWTILGCLLLGLVTAFLVASQLPTLYRAKARILLTAKPVPGPREDAMSTREIQAEMAHLRSPALIRGVVEDYAEEDKLEPTTPGFGKLKRQLVGWVRGLSSRFQAGSQTTELGREVLRLASRVQVRSIDGTNVVEVSYASHDPQWAATFVNDLLDHHVERIASSNEALSAGPFFQEQRNLLAVRWEEARAALNKFREEHGANLLAGDERHLQSVLSDLESQHVTAGTTVLELEAKVDFLTAETDNHPGTINAESRVTEDESVSFLRSRILELEIERSELLSRYTPTSTVIRNLDRRIEEARRLLESKEGETLEETMTAVNPARQTLEIDLVQTQGQLVAARARTRALEEQIEVYRRQLRRLEDASSELERLENDVTSAKEAYQTYLQKEEEARLSTSLNESGIVNVSIFESAEVPVTAEPDKKELILGAGAALGLFLGLALAFVRDLLDPTVQSSAQAYRLSGVPIIAEIPQR